MRRSDGERCGFCAQNAPGPSLMNIVLLVLLFFYVVFFFWILWKSAQGWRWYHLVAASLTFLLIIPLLPMTAVVVKSRAAWNREVEQLETRLARAERERDSWINGVPGDAEKDPGLLDMQAKLRGLTAEVGRVFRDMQVTNRGPQGFSLQRMVAAPAVTPDGMPVEEPVADPAANAVPAGPLVATDTILYAFAEQTDGQFLPIYYLGQYQVTNSDTTSVTVVPTVPLEPWQLQAANQAMRWALYEVMPMDGHGAFIAEGSVEDDDQIFGRVDDQLVQALMGSNVSPETLAAYLRDGSRGRDDDAPATKWEKIEFTKKYELTVDAMEQRDAKDGGFFDNLGQAVDARLQRAEGDVVTFEEGDQLVVKAEAAEALVSEGVARRIDTYFVRPLNSYKYAMRAIRLQINYLTEQTADLQRQQAVLQVAVDLTTDMQTKGQQRKIELEKDEAQVGRELAAIQSYVSKLETELASVKDEMGKLYQDNIVRESELEAIQRSLLEAANQRVNAALGSES